MHSKFLFEPQRYWKANYTSIFKKFIPRDRTRKDICSFAFEANPRHNERHKKLEAYHRSFGRRHTSYNVAAGSKTGRMFFYHTNTEKELQHNEWAFGIKKPHKAAFTKVEVDVIDLAAWVNVHVHARRIPETTSNKKDLHPPAVLIKFDIEGSEHTVLLRMLFTGALCGVDGITLEWHDGLCVGDQQVCASRPTMLQMLKLAHRVPGCKLGMISDLDDEHYWNDTATPVHWPPRGDYQ